MFDLGVLYRDGLGVAQDYDKARELFQKAADAGDADAMNNLGALYGKGLGVAQDYGKAREWYQKGADAGNTDSMFNWVGRTSTARALPKGCVLDVSRVRRKFQVPRHWAACRYSAEHR